MSSSVDSHINELIFMHCGVFKMLLLFCFSPKWNEICIMSKYLMFSRRILHNILQIDWIDNIKMYTCLPTVSVSLLVL